MTEFEALACKLEFDSIYQPCNEEIIIKNPQVFYYCVKETVCFKEIG